MRELSYDTNTGPMSSPRDFAVNLSPLVNGLYDTGQGFGAIAASDRKAKWEIAKEQEKIQQGNDQLWVTKQLADVQMKYVQKHVIEQSYDETPEKFQENWTAMSEKMLAGAKTPEARAALERSLADMQPNFFVQNTRGIAEANNKRAEADFYTAAQNISDAGAATGEFDDATKNIEDLSVAVTGSANAAQPIINETQTKAVVAASQHYGPGNAAAMLRKGQVGAKLPATERKLLAAQLDDDEVAIAATSVYQSRAAIADMETRAKAGDAKAIAALPEAQDQLKAAEERLTFATAKPDSDLELLDHADEIFSTGIEAASRKGATLSMPEVERAFNTIVGQATARGMRGASPEKIRRLIDNRKERYGDTHPATVFAQKIAGEQAKLFKEDPAEYVMQDGGLLNIIRSSANNPAQFAAAMDESLRRQADFAGQFGEVQRKVLTNTKRIELGAKIKAMASGQPVEIAPGNVRKATPDETMAFIDGIVTSYGHHGTAVLRELSENKDENSKIPAEALIAAALPPALGGVRSNLVKQLNNTPEELRQMSGVSAGEMQKELSKNAMFNNFVGSNMGVSAGGISGPQAVEWADAVERTAQRLLITKAAGNQQQAVKMAVEQTIGAIWDVDGMLRVPKIAQTGKVQDTGAVKAGLDAMTPALLPHLDTSYYDAPVGIFDNIRASVIGQKRLSQQLSWVTSEDGYSAQLMARKRDGSLAQVKTKEGEDVVVSFERAKEFPIAAPSYPSMDNIAPDKMEINPLDYIFKVRKAEKAGWQPNKNDVRKDGSQKGEGFLGVLKRKDGGVSTEISVGVDFGNGEMEIPLIVPTLTGEEVKYLLDTPAEKLSSSKKIYAAIEDKAIAHAKKRLKDGKGVFAAKGEEMVSNDASFIP